MNDKLAALLREKKPTKRGIHGTGNAWEGADYYGRQIREWQECGFSWVKLVAASDSQLQTVWLLQQQAPEMIPIIRFWHGEQSYPGARLDPAVVKKYVDAGALLFEPINEPYLEWRGGWTGSGADFDALAYQWGTMADAIVRAGGVPLTPAIEGWRYEDVFEPLFKILATRYRPLLEQSVIAAHLRTLNHPPTYDKDAGGLLGWRWMDALAKNWLGESLPILATEAGPEPGWNQDATFPAVNVYMHSQWSLDMVRSDAPPVIGWCSWLWEGTGAWANASWKRNAGMGGADLPVVSLFKNTRDAVVEPEPPPDLFPPESVEAMIRRWCYDNIYPQGIAYNPDAALQKGENMGAPCTHEHSDGGYTWQGYTGGIKYCRTGDWSNVEVLPWAS